MIFSKRYYNKKGALFVLDPVYLICYLMRMFCFMFIVQFYLMLLVNWIPKAFAQCLEWIICLLLLIFKFS